MHDRKNVTVIVGGQYGSEAKGKIAAYLASEFHLAVRSGGPNAGHTIETGGHRRVFRHLPCAVVNQRCTALLASGAVIDRDVLLEEIRDSALSAERLLIDPRAVLISDEHRNAELALVSRIGSTGKGVGAAVADKVMRKPSVALARDDSALQQYLGGVATHLHEAIAKGLPILLEGNQGAGLSLHHGQYPFVTSRDVTAGSLCGEAGIGPTRVGQVVMVVRAYPTRIAGPSGPLEDEISWGEVTAEAGSQVPIIEHTSVGIGTLTPASPVGKVRRVARFDIAAVRYAAMLNGATQLALTFCDYLNTADRNCTEFGMLSAKSRHFIDALETNTDLPVTLIGTGPDTHAIIDRR